MIDKETTFTPLDYLAYCLYRNDCAVKNTNGVLWGTMRHGVRNKYLRKARANVDAWGAKEVEYKQLRDEGNPRAYFAPPAPEVAAADADREMFGDDVEAYGLENVGCK
jgi:hypothetical protein